MSKRGQKETTVAADAKNDRTVAVVDNEAHDETLKAADAVLHCSKLAVASALVDICVTIGMQVVVDWKTQEGFSKALRSLWKLGFAYNTWHAAQLYKLLVSQQNNNAIMNSQSNKVKEEEEGRHQAQALVQILRYGASTWRISAIVVTIGSVTNVILAWGKEIPQLEQHILLIIVGVVTLVAYIQWDETRGIKASALRDYQEHHHTSKAQIKQQAVTTVRAMLMCAAAFWLQAVTIPVLAYSHYYHHSYTGTSSSSSSSLVEPWRGVILELMGISTPMGVVKLLRSVRKGILGALSDPIHEGQATLNLQSKSQRKLAKSQQALFNDVASTFKSEIFGKAVFELISPQGLVQVIFCHLFSSVLIEAS
ncbi:expressed unknown protein [Seminavis robusta]|uniref:Uncharacterized protein n=1 Tax=Seminavis robusta TaxID=568900 RepID=A0A9N8EXW7_9STRA|nr:expressed unknown protein [Seminavis robusta]|eukprot:Sro2212_g319230.1 n/a (366) ;mRNA; r:1311-2408